MSFTVYKSSAGSGKTYTLVKEYLKIILVQPEDFRSVLAITFTNKAANEMKERVISNLRILSNDEMDDAHPVVKFLLPELLKETNLDRDSLIKNAKKALLLILHNYSDFAISTIDSFVHKIVKTFAYDLKLSFNFEVELDAEKLLKQAIDVLINRVGIEDELTDLLCTYTESKADDETSWHIENDLLNLAKTLTDENGQDYLNLLKCLDYSDFKKIAKSLNKFNRSFIKEINDKARIATDLINKHQIDLKSFYFGKSGIGSYFNKLSDTNVVEFLPNSRVLATIEKDIWYGKSLNETEKDKIDGIKNSLRDIYDSIQLTLEDSLQKYNLYSILYKQIYPLAVLSEVEKILEDIKSQHNLIHISEFNKKISEIVFSEPVPFIYERLGERYKHFLIDEFQDTSLLQWQNLIPLVENSLAEGYFNMLVGDGKQAIYRWRNGEVEQFANLPNIFKKDALPFAEEKEQSFKRNYNERYLRNNFRSKKEIISFNNRFFEAVSSLLEVHFSGIYQGGSQLFDNSDTGGYVQLEFVEKNNGDESPMLAKLLDAVQDVLKRGKQKKDIAILCRTKNEAKNCSQYLMEHNIEILSSESLLLSASPEINFIISFFKCLLNTEDSVNTAYILQYFINRNLIKENNLSEVFSNNQEFFNLNKYLNTRGIAYNSNSLLSLPLYDLLEETIRLFHFDEKMDAYLQFFMDATLQYSLSQNSNLTDYLEWWDEVKSKESVIVPEGVNAVQVMTIHKAKGLEFPVVIYPFATAHNRNGLDYFWSNYKDETIPELKVVNLPYKKALLNTSFEKVYEKEHEKRLLDLINLVYVAFTRPAEELYVFTNPPAKSNSDTVDVSRLIQYYLQQNGEWDENKLVYNYGIKEVFLTKEAKDHSAPVLKKLHSVNWRKSLSLSTEAPDTWDVDDPDKHVQKGKLVHYLLSQVYTEEDVEDVVSAGVYDGIIEADQTSDLKAYLLKIINHPDISVYFKKGLKVKNEADILLSNGQTLRPDRLILNDDEVIIIDYKTGKPIPSHETQLLNYEKALRELDFPNIKKILIYLSSSVSVKIL